MVGDEGYPLTFLAPPTRELVPAILGSLPYPAAALALVAGEPSFLRMFRPVEPEDLPVEPEDLPVDPDFSPPLRVGLLTLCGLAAVPPVLPGSSGFRMARGPVDVAVPPALVPGRLIRRSWVRPAPLSAFRRRTRPPSSG
jgi:hypothetical protein